jgi:hypothetical protein
MWGIVSSKEGRKHMQASITTAKLEEVQKRMKNKDKSN